MPLALPLQVPQGAISMCVFKLYLGRMLGTCNQRSENASLSGPLLLYQHLVSSCLLIDLGTPMEMSLIRA